MSFNEFLIGKNVVRKATEYGRILEEESNYTREYAAFMIKPKNQREDVIVDLDVPYHQEASSSHYYFNPVSSADTISKINSRNKQILGRFHYHGIHAANPSSVDEKERKFILAETIVNNKIFINEGGGIVEGKFLKAKINESGNDSRILLQTDNPYLGKFELKMKKRRLLFPQIKFLHPYIPYAKRFFERIYPHFIDVDDFNGQIDFLFYVPAVYGYGYNFILNKRNEMYAEIIYQKIELSGPVGGLKFKPLKVRVVNHPNDTQFTEEDLRNDIIEKFNFEKKV